MRTIKRELNEFRMLTFHVGVVDAGEEVCLVMPAPAWPLGRLRFGGWEEAAGHAYLMVTKIRIDRAAGIEVTLRNEASKPRIVYGQMFEQGTPSIDKPDGGDAPIEFIE